MSVKLAQIQIENLLKLCKPNEIAAAIAITIYADHPESRELLEALEQVVDTFKGHPKSLGRAQSGTMTKVVASNFNKISSGGK
jgi:hypothetical protein